MNYLAGVVALIAVTGWVASDAARRGHSWLGWSILVFFTGALGAIAWLFVRRHSPVTQRVGPARQALLRLVGIPLLIVAFPLVVFVQTFLVQVARVQGHSMEPTLHDQQRVIINKLVYRTGEPRRGDVVMFYYPLRPEKIFVQRLIAEQNDTVQIVDGRVLLNGSAIRDDYVAAEFLSHDNWGPRVVPEGYCFVMGDHRNNSSDSRHWGWVPKRYIVGRIVE